MIQLKLAKPSEYTDNTVGLFIKDICEAGNDVILECKNIKVYVGQRNSRFALHFYRKGVHLHCVTVDCYKYIGSVFMSELRKHHKYLKVYRNFPWGRCNNNSNR